MTTNHGFIQVQIILINQPINQTNQFAAFSQSIRDQSGFGLINPLFTVCTRNSGTKQNGQVKPEMNCWLRTF